MKAINLVPREQRRSFGVLQGLGLGTTALFGALSLAFVVVAAYVVLANGVTSKKTELADVQAQQTAATRKVAQLKPYAELEQLRTSLLERVKSVAGSRYDWPGTLARIARAFPSNASLDSLDGTGASDSSGPSITMSGCTPSHNAAALLIDHLRAVKGVAGVSLQSSKVETASGTDTAPSTGCSEKFQLNVSLEAPAGAAAATPAAGAATPAPGTTATPASTPATGGTK